MNTKFTYNNFYEILELSDKKLQEIKLKEFIDNYEFNDFFNHDRRWFNSIVQHGLVNLLYYCEKTIPYFSLYDKHNPVDHFSNVSFLWAIESGDVDTLNYFFNHPDFSSNEINKSLFLKISMYFSSLNNIKNFSKFSVNEYLFFMIISSIISSL